MKRVALPLRIIVQLSLCALLFLVNCKQADHSDRSPGSTSQGIKRIALLNNGNSPFWDACRIGLQRAATDLHLDKIGLSVFMEVNDATVQGQIEKLRNFATRTDIAGVAISALDAANAAVAGEMERLKRQGVHVICVDADVDRQRFRHARSYYIGTDNLAGGRELGIAARNLLEARNVRNGSYVQFVGRSSSQNAIERMDGFKIGVGSNYRQADRATDDNDRTRARENVRNAINNHPDLVALVGIWSYNAPAIVDVVRQVKKRDRLTIVAFDAEPIAVEQMAQGDIDAMVVQNPLEMGYQAVRLLKAMIEKDSSTIREMFPNEGTGDGDLYDTGLKVVVPDQSSSLKRELFGSRTVFMTLSEFKAWLNKLGLTGS